MDDAFPLAHRAVLRETPHHYLRRIAVLAADIFDELAGAATLAKVSRQALG
ncbi:MAG: hypothetical protein ABIP20_03245 [Chthoniobacteraceae bacterium]